jgi:hypothetical protein
MVRAEFPEVIVVETGANLGFAKANNVALRQMRGRTALLLNSDTIVKPGALQSMLSTLDAHPEAAAIGPRLLNQDGTLQPSCYRFPSPGRAFRDQLFVTAVLANNPRWGDFRRWSHDTIRNVDFVIGAALLVRAEVISSVGMLDENFFMYAEETDWMYRMHKAGYTVLFTPEAEIIHYGGGSGKAVADRVFVEFSRGQRRFYRKHYGKLGEACLIASLVLGALIRVPMNALIALLLPAQRTKAWSIVKLWMRILMWNLGIWRSPGLCPSS